MGKDGDAFLCLFFLLLLFGAIQQEQKKEVVERESPCISEKYCLEHLK